MKRQTIHQGSQNSNIQPLVTSNRKTRTSKRNTNQQQLTLPIQSKRIANQLPQNIIESEDSEDVKCERKKSKSKHSKNKKKQISKKGKKVGHLSKQQSHSTIKLQRGYKFCQNCKTILNIHKYVCTECGFVHNMKKHKFDVMKNLSKGTPKIIKSIIESNEFNYIKANAIDSKIFPASFQIASNQNKPQNAVQIQGKKAKTPEIKSRKSQQKNKINQDQKPKIANLNKNLQELNFSENNGNASSDKIIFTELKINKLESLIEMGSEQQKQKKTNQFDQNREQFSMYRSQYPIVALQPIQIFQNKKSSQNEHHLIFIESISKKTIQIKQNTRENSLFIGNMQTLENEISQSHQSEQGKQNFQRGAVNQLNSKKQQDRKRIEKINQNNLITQKALELQKFHKLGTKYQGQSVINILNVTTNSKTHQTSSKQSKFQTNGTQKREPQQYLKRGKSSTSNKQKKQHDKTNGKQNQNQRSKQDQHEVIRVGLRQHIQLLRAIKNKVSILTGRKQIILLNLKFNPNLSQNPNQNNLLEKKQKDNFGNEKSQQHKFSSNLNTEVKQSPNLLWLDIRSQNNQSTQGVLKNFGTISLSKAQSSSRQQDQFTAIEWLKLYSESKNSISDDQISYLATGTLFGHIIIYRVEQNNLYSTYRTIVGAHFQLINIIKECPLSNAQFGVFASASYDGSVKVWDIQEKQSVCQIQVSNRKVQQMHWDSGAKFLLIVRDQGLENCYLACFYSISNRIELPISLVDTIDFRLIRNGVAFDNSCSPLISYPLNSKLIVMMNSRNGFLKIVQSEQLRKTSLKRKKSKKNCHQEIYHDFWIRLNQSPAMRKMIQNIEIGENKKLKEFIQSNELIQVIQMKNNLNLSSHLKFRFNQMIEDDDQDKQKQSRSFFRNDEEDSQSSSSNIKKGLDQYSMVKNPDNPHVKASQVVKDKIPKVQAQVMGVRKSLRVRKSNIQYNFMEEQDISIQEQKNNKKPAQKKKKKQGSSDQSDSYDDSDDDSESGQNEESIDSSYEKSIHMQKKKGDESKVKVNNQRKVKNSMNSTQQVSRRGQSGLRTRAPKNNQIPEGKESKSLENAQKDKVQQAFCQLFWQETSQQSLIKIKEEYPCNKFPKFSSMVSFVTIQKGSNQKQHRNQQNNPEQVQKVESKNGRFSIKKGSKQKEAKKNQCRNKTIGKIKRKTKGQQGQKLAIDQDQSEFISNQLQKDNIDSNSEDAKQNQISSQNNQSSDSQFQSNQSKPKAKSKVSNTLQMMEQDQSKSNQTEYLTTFIAGYSGQLIKIRIKVEGYQQPERQE